MSQEPNTIISTILKHDNKQTSYKIALLRAINDVVLSFPNMRSSNYDIAVPIRVLAEFWLAYYWPFVDPTGPIMQGARANRGGNLRNDMAFRPELTVFRSAWQAHWGGISNPADGFFVINELRVPRIRASQPKELLTLYHKALQKIARTIEMPVRYAGPGEWNIFNKPVPLSKLWSVVAIPGTLPDDKCLVITAGIWDAFRELSLWVEALCIHEWCQFTERVEQGDTGFVDRGFIYTLLTDRPDNRRPLTWERNHIDILLMEGNQFICPWSQRRITKSVPYDLDHLLPVSIYPINEMWNLVPSDPHFNQHAKRASLPAPERLTQARPHLELAYRNYEVSDALSNAMHNDVAIHFSAIRQDRFPQTVAQAVVDFMQAVGRSRNIAHF